MAKLTVNFIKSLKATGTAYRKMDDGYAGFGVKVSPSGKISFIFRYKATDGRDVPMVLGYHPQTTLAQARELWSHWRAIYDSGRDPKTVQAEQLEREEENRKATALQRKHEAMQGSVRQLLEAYTNDLKTNGKRSWSETERVFETNVYQHIPATTKAKDVLPDDIRAVLAEIIQRDALVMANRVRAYLSAAFAFGISWDNDSRRHFESLRFGIKTNPVRDVPKPLKSEKPRDRALSEFEVKQVWEALGDSDFHPKTIGAIRLLFALGGQRVEDVLFLTEDDVDFVNRLVTFRDTKNGTTHVIPFGDVAEPLLKERMLDTNAGGELFGKIKSKREEPIDSTTLSHAITKLCRRINLEHFQPKDIRRTAKTLMGFAGISKEARDRFQNHALTDVSSKHYDRYNYLAEHRQTSAVWDAYLQNILAGSPQANVVQLRVVGE
ncbi:MAG: site-specific integrase [Candidatus Thiothrix sulfatifontis]|nr:MAG: site-specific integrase [Candidatus Thiothrix sulfatifontis]